MAKKKAKKKVAKKKAKKKVAKKKAKKKVTKKKAAEKAKDLCFVLMPFKEPFDAYYTAIIEPAITKAGLRAQKGDSLFLPTPIMGDIWSLIQEAKVIVAILTGKNANVFYELGLGHAIGKPIVLVSETMVDVPFDLQALRVILYDKDHPKWGDRLRSKITNTLQATIAQPIEAVPTMFRKKVKNQAPSESETSSRLALLERKVASLDNTELRSSYRYETTAQEWLERQFKASNSHNERILLARDAQNAGVSRQQIGFAITNHFGIKEANDIMAKV